MHMKHGKIKFGYKDAYDCTYVLSPIIRDCITNFRDVLIERENEGKFVGVPNLVLEDLFGKEYVEQKYISGDGLSPQDLQQGVEHWLSILDQIIYAFNPDLEPDYQGGWTESEGHLEDVGDGLTRWNITPDEDKWKEYMDAREGWYEQVTRGRELFSKFYDCLWW